MTERSSIPVKIRIQRTGVLAATAGAAAVALLLAGCASSSTPESTNSSSAPASETPSPSASVLPAAATCSGSEDNASTFKLGTFLPLTGSLASLGPAAVAGAGQALSEINAAGGVNGAPACVLSTDSSDIDNATVGEQNIQKLLQAKVSAILGAESSSVTENVLDTVAAQKVVMFSPANTDDALTGASDWYFRDAPPNSVEGDALGKQIVADGNSKVGILVFNDAYGTNLRDSIQKSIEGAGGTVVYGGKGKGQEFPSSAKTFDSEVSAVVATSPDAIVIDAFDQTNLILPALKQAGWDMSKVYFVDGNLNDYSSDSNVPDLTGATGSTQGVNATDEFKATLTAWYAANEKGAALTAFGYAAESYDAVVIMALAADVAGASDPASIQKNILPVTGSTNGTVCKSYSECLDLIKGGTKDIWYQGLSGIGPLNEGHDPSSGYISIYQYEGKAPSKFLTSVKGSL
jgi:neutral amino acid transport system substrate-binding protein